MQFDLKIHATCALLLPHCVLLYVSKKQAALSALEACFLKTLDQSRFLTGVPLDWYLQTNTD